MKKLLFLSFCLIWLPLFSSAQIIQGESTTTQTLFVPEKKIPEKGYPRYQGDIYLGYAGDDICLSLTTTHGIRINKYQRSSSASLIKRKICSICCHCFTDTQQDQRKRIRSIC